MGSQIIRRFQNMFEIFEVNKNGTRDTVEKKTFYFYDRVTYFGRKILKKSFGGQIFSHAGVEKWCPALYTATPRPDEVAFKKNRVNEGGDEITFLRGGK